MKLKIFDISTHEYIHIKKIKPIIRFLCNRFHPQPNNIRNYVINKLRRCSKYSAVLISHYLLSYKTRPIRYKFRKIQYKNLLHYERLNFPQISHNIKHNKHYNKRRKIEWKRKRYNEHKNRKSHYRRKRPYSRQFNLQNNKVAFYKLQFNNHKIYFKSIERAVNYLEMINRSEHAILKGNITKKQFVHGLMRGIMYNRPYHGIKISTIDKKPKITHRRRRRRHHQKKSNRLINNDIKKLYHSRNSYEFHHNERCCRKDEYVYNKYLYYKYGGTRPEANDYNNRTFKYNKDITNRYNKNV